MKKISILGCGWLGFPLACHLQNKGHQIKGSTTSGDKIAILAKNHITPFQIAISELEILGDMGDFLRDSEILVINIPPKLRQSQAENYTTKIRLLLPFINESTIKKVLFVSSTSVYNDNNTVVTESDATGPTSENGRQILEAEKLLQEATQFLTTVVRFGGLLGEDRHPVHFLAGRKGVADPKGPINLIHLVDCIGVIARIIETDCWNETFNAVAPFHPDRESYYTSCAIQRNLTAPIFDHRSDSKGKLVSTEKLVHLLQYQFKKSQL